MNGRKGQRAMTLIVLLLLIPAMGQTARAYVHPGGLHTRADLDRMKAQVAAGAHPWIDDWNLFITDPRAQSTYTASPSVNMASRQTASADAHAAYLNALRGYVGNSTANTDAAIAICN